MARKKSLEEKIWTKVQCGKPDECWEWQGALKGEGYGYISVRVGPRSSNRSKKILAHRAVYELTKGPIPPGHVVRHLCHNKRCVSPHHLAAGSHADNMRDQVEARRSLSGEDNPAAKLSYEKVGIIREMRRKGFTLKKIAKTFGVHFSTIDLIVRGKIWNERRSEDPSD